MSKNATLTLFFLAFAIATSAQKTSPKKLLSRFELVGGSSFSKNIGYLPDYHSKAEYSFGVGYYQKIYKTFSINLRSLYEMKGSAVRYASNIDGTQINDDITIKSKYLSFYMMPTLQFGRQKRIYIGAGGYYSLLQNLNVKSYHSRADTGAKIEEYQNTNTDYFTFRYDAGLSFQIGYSFNLNEKYQLMLQAFSNRGLIDLTTAKIGSHRNNAFGLLLSLRMR